MKRILLLFLITAFISGCIVVEECPTVANTGTVDNTGVDHDLTKEDVFSLLKANQITSKDISIKGVKLGDTFPEVTDAFGMPYSLEEYEEGHIINARYLHPELNVTTLIFHMVDDVIERIVVRSAYNEYLHGKTIIDRDKDEITSFFGKPDFFEDTVALRTYYYNDLGLEIYHKRKQMIGFGLVPEGSSVRPESDLAYIEE